MDTHSHRDDASRARAANLRMAAILLSIALVFFGGIIAAKFLGGLSIGLTVLGATVMLFLVVAIGRNLWNGR
jgi:hypothetical protein